MGYRVKFITLKFDGSQEGMDDVGDGCFVTLKNPKLRPLSDLGVDNVEVDEAGNVKDSAAARAASQAVRAKLIVDWCVWDPDTDEPLAVPTAMAPGSLDRAPACIARAIDTEIVKAFPQ